MKYINAALLIAILVLSGCQSATPAATSIPTERPTDTPTLTAIPSETPTPLPTDTPTPVVYPPVDEQLALGDNHTCLLHSTGTVSCWGWNQYGQTGQSNETIVTGEETITGLVGIQAVSAGAYHTCALDQQGQVWCWGRNNDGQLGDGTNQDSPTPVLVRGFLDRMIQAISAGSMHTCAIDRQGGVWCWGSNRNGKLGQAVDSFSFNTPQQLTSLATPVSLIAAGSSHTCAVDANHDLWCWGEGTFGQVGLNPFAGSTQPVLLTHLNEEVISIQAGWFHTCLLTASGRVMCWGKNQDGQLGNAAQISRADLVSPVNMAADVQLLASGGQSNCSLKKDGSLTCWGRNNYGQIGDQTTIERLIPVPVHLPFVPKQLAIGGSHACELGAEGQIACWGANDLGQLGSYGTNPVPTPTVTVRVPTRQP